MVVALGEGGNKQEMSRRSEMNRYHLLMMVELHSCSVISGGGGDQVIDKI